MSILTNPDVRPERVLLEGIRWDTYEALLNDLEGRRRLRLTYDGGALEIMSPSKSHEWYKRLIGRMIEVMTLVLGIPIQSTGSTTWRRRILEKGLEGDESYYVAREPLVRGRPDHDESASRPVGDLWVLVGWSLVG